MKKIALYSFLLISYGRSALFMLFLLFGRKKNKLFLIVLLFGRKKIIKPHIITMRGFVDL